jgi:hypothetical protein
MHTKHASLRKPSFPFPLDQLPDPFRLDEFQVFNLAHAIFRPVALIEMPQPRTRKFRACAAKSAGALPANTQRTFHSCLRPILLGKIAPKARIPLSQARLAHRTIHPASSDKFWDQAPTELFGPLPPKS